MPETPSTEALAVAYLTAQGRKQNEIAEILNISQAAVSRLYKAVKDDYIERRFRVDQVDELELAKIQRMASPETLRASLEALAAANGTRSPVVYRMSTGSLHPVEDFALQAALVVKDLISRARSTVGVAWGNTIWHVSQALRTLPPQKPWRQQFPVDFIPLCGDPLMDSSEVIADRTSSRIASELSKTVNGDDARAAWLGLVPAFVPRNNFTEKEIKVINRLIDLVPQYGRIFGPRVRTGATRTPAAADLHMILTSAGPAEHPIGFGRSPLLNLDKKESDLLAENICGDIGGVLVPKLGNAKVAGSRPHPLVEELTGYWTGLKMEHLENCSRRAFEQDNALGGRPGVVLLGFQEDRAPVVIDAVRRGLVNHLVVGPALEAAIGKLIPAQSLEKNGRISGGGDGVQAGEARRRPDSPKLMR